MALGTRNIANRIPAGSETTLSEANVMADG